MGNHSLENTYNTKEKEFKRLFEAYSDRLFHYAFTILRDTGEAEDIVQAVFMNVWEKHPNLENIHTIKSYLYKSVYNLSMNRLDQLKVRLRYQKEQSHQSAIYELPNAFDHELHQYLTKAIDQLPPRCREIFVLSRYDGLRYAEIAAQLQISVNTVENQMSKALKILRDQMKGMWLSE